MRQFFFWHGASIKHLGCPPPRLPRRRPPPVQVLFVAGFGSSMFFGTFIGSLADRLGRKRFCLLYAALYIASCLTK